MNPFPTVHRVERTAVRRLWERPGNLGVCSAASRRMRTGEKRCSESPVAVVSARFTALTRSVIIHRLQRCVGVRFHDEHRHPG